MNFFYIQTSMITAYHTAMLSLKQNNLSTGAWMVITYIKYVYKALSREQNTYLHDQNTDKYEHREHIYMSKHITSTFYISVRKTVVHQLIKPSMLYILRNLGS